MKALIHFSRFLAGLDRPHSQLTDDELDRLLKHARDVKIAVELGCAEGRTAVALAGVVRDTVYSVDIFRRGRLGICYAYWIARVHRWRQHRSNLVLLKGTSQDVVHRFDQPIDLLFIDADHSYEAVRADWELWGPKVRPGGIIACHDCRVAPSSRNYLGSMRFYEEHIRRARWVAEIDGVDSLAVFRVVSAPADEFVQDTRGVQAGSS